MGLFNLYCKLENYDLYDFIEYKNAYIGWEQDENWPYIEHQIIKEELDININIYNYFICVESLPNKLIIHYGDNFTDKIEVPREISDEWLFAYGYKQCKQYILKECYACLEYAINGIEQYCKAVAHNRAMRQMLLYGD